MLGVASVLAVLVAPPVMAQSGNGSTTMAVTAIVASTCAVVAQPLAFGTLSLSGGNNDSQTTITLTCTPGTGYTVGLDGGAHSAAGVRRMAGTIGSSTIPYYIYTNASRTSEWGNTTGVNTMSGTAASAATNLTVYGRVPGNASFFTAGGYTDTVNVTVTF